MTPACREARCKWSMSYDMVNLRRVYQHGENGEAVLLIDDYDVATAEPPPGVRRSVWMVDYIVQRVADWAERVHEYEQRRAAQATEGRGE